MGKFINRITELETTGAEEWKDLLLGTPEEIKRQWEEGHSARAVAYCWEEADGFPPEVIKVFDDSDFPVLRGLKLLVGYPEDWIDIPGIWPPIRHFGRYSFNDVSASGRNVDQGRVAIAVEAKVAEGFGRHSVKQWLEVPRTGDAREDFASIREVWGRESWDKDWKSWAEERVSSLGDYLGLDHEGEGFLAVRYQFLLRTVGALFLAEKTGAKIAVMLVHSFSQTNENLRDYKDFVELFGTTGDVNTVSYAGNKNGIDLYLAWVRGEERFLRK